MRLRYVLHVIRTSSSKFSGSEDCGPDSSGAAGRLDAVYLCDPAADGRFWYGVTSTRIYCRPSCRSRAPRPERIRFFSSPAAAEAEGYRPCKRCLPRLPGGALSLERERMRRAREFLRRDCAGPIRWEDAAGVACLSPPRFHRAFREAVGIPPGEFLTRCRVDAARELLAASDRPVLEIALAAGFGSQAALYRAFRRFVGVSPGRYRREASS